jgi:hypothetical protein
MGFLITSQRAMLYRILRVSEFNPFDFEIVPTTARTLSNEEGDSLRFRDSPYYFAVYPNERDDSYFPDKFLVEYSLGREQIPELESCPDWQAVCMAFEGYLTQLSRERLTRDPAKEDAGLFAEVAGRNQNADARVHQRHDDFPVGSVPTDEEDSSRPMIRGHG